MEDELLSAVPLRLPTGGSDAATEDNSGKKKKLSRESADILITWVHAHIGIVHSQETEDEDT